jgi:hypothetical protein
MPPVQVLHQVGYLEPSEHSEASVQAIFGKAASSSLIDSNSDAHLRFGDPGGHVVAPLSGVQTMDLASTTNATKADYRPSAANLLHPMHSESLWLLLLVLAVLGVFSFGIHLGPVRASVG